MKHTQLHLDFETFSEVDITERGGMIYARDDSTMPICLSYGFEEGPVELWTPDKEMPNEVLDAVADGIKVYAHNAAFDFRIWNFICVPQFGWPEWTVDQTVDTMALCQTYTLPGSLDKAGQAMNLVLPKTAGTALIKRCCCLQPIKEGGKARGKIIGYHRPSPWDLQDAKFFSDLYKYCIRDTEAMRELVSKLPRQELLPKEHEIWKMTFEMNTTGLPCDPVEVKAIMGRINEFLKVESKRLREITEDYLNSPYQYAKIKSYCDKEGFPIKNCQGDYVNDLLDDPKEDIPYKVRAVLSLCQILGKTSTAKFRAFNNFMTPTLEGDARDYRVHDTFCFHGAGPGRWAGRGIQPHNFPRAKSKNPDADIERFVNGEPIEDPIGLAKKLVRSIVKAPKGYVIMVSDYKAIENRGLAWVADDKPTIKLFEKGHDQYIDMAADRYGLTYREIKEGVNAEIGHFKDKRQMGKVIILGCGYGMGWETFMQTAWKQFRMLVEEEDSRLAIGAYREKYHKVVECWKQLKLAATRAVLTGKRQKYGIIEFGTATVNGVRWLAMRLPSGKSIYYHTPRVEQRFIPKFEKMGKVPTVTHLGIHPYSKKWTRLPLIPGRITENAVQGTAREIMAQGMLNVRERMPQAHLIGTVHDEAITLIREEDVYDDTLEQFNTLLCDVPWAEGCPLAAEGFIDTRYRKD